MSETTPTAEKARLLLAAARYLGETLEPLRVYERFREIVAEAIPHQGVIVSSYTEDDGLIRCDYAWVDGERLDPTLLPPLTFQHTSGGMQSQVIRTGEPLLVNDVRERVKGKGTYYDVDGTGSVRKLPETGEPLTQAAMMLPVRHEGRVVGVVQLSTENGPYTEDQLELAEGMVAQLGASVRNARLYESVQLEAAARLRAEEERGRLEAREAAAQAVAAEREDEARVLEALGEGIAVVSEDGSIRVWNRAAEVVTGLSAARALTRPIAEVFVDWAAVTANVPVSSGTALPRSVTVPVLVNGRELWLSFVAVQSGVGTVYAFRDITFERRLEESKSEFIATVSHELRTPMTAVLGAATTLLRHDLDLTPAQRHELAEMIASQAQRLSNVTDEILLATSLDRNDVRLETGRVDVAAVVRDTVDALASDLPDRVEVALSLGDVGAAIADRDRLQQVLVNLIDNAVKYSPDGGAIRVSTARVSGSHVRIAVTDEGIGIAPAEQERVFEKFYRVDPSLTHGPSGTGLGLYICRGLVERMGGQIAVTSEAGVGSTFMLDLAAA